MPNKPRLTLVGAGPGDPELITLKAVKALQNADVVLYDALLDKRILEHAPKALKIYVGKRKGTKAYSQDEIHELIVKHAFRDGHVVRLKGGDPFIFGRGSEELEYASHFGIPSFVIPGISSAHAVPASLGISVTQRFVSESYWVITGTTSDHKLSADLLQASATTATVVILMGFGKLNKIVELYSNLGRGNLPVAVIQNGTFENENFATGTISTILEEVSRRKIGTPAIIVIGDVVKHAIPLKKLFKESVNNRLQIA